MIEEQFISKCKEILAKKYDEPEDSIEVVMFSYASCRYQAVFEVAYEYCVKAIYEFSDGIFFSSFKETEEFQVNTGEKNETY